MLFLADLLVHKQTKLKSLLKNFTMPERRRAQNFPEVSLHLITKSQNNLFSQPLAEHRPV